MGERMRGPWTPEGNLEFERRLSQMERRAASPPAPQAAERRTGVERRSSERTKPVKKEIVGFARPRTDPDIGDTGVLKKLRTWQARGVVPKKRGGSVSAAEAKRIAERVVGEHVRYPAPKGHKGFEKIYPARR
jgi:hypothetical protein